MVEASTLRAAMIIMKGSSTVTVSAPMAQHQPKGKTCKLTSWAQMLRQVRKGMLASRLWMLKKEYACGQTSTRDTNVETTCMMLDPV